MHATEGQKAVYFSKEHIFIIHKHLETKTREIDCTAATMFQLLYIRISIVYSYYSQII